MPTKPAYKLPAIKAIRALLIALKPQIEDDFRATDDPGDTTPGMQVTIGASPDGSWDYQTGDNSFSGGAYGHAHWGVVYLSRSSNSTELARDCVNEIAESMASTIA